MHRRLAPEETVARSGGGEGPPPLWNTSTSNPCRLVYNFFLQPHEEIGQARRKMLSTLQGTPCSPVGVPVRRGRRASAIPLSTDLLRFAPAKEMRKCHAEYVFTLKELSTKNLCMTLRQKYAVSLTEKRKSITGVASCSAEPASLTTSSRSRSRK